MFIRCIATSITHMDDNQFVAAHAVIDKIGITGGWKYADSGDVGFPSEARVSR